VVLAALLWTAPAQADPIADCDSDDAERIVAGCSVVIARGGLADADLAIAYSRRSDGYLAFGKFDDAFADQAKALALDPAGPGYQERLRDIAIRKGDAALASGDAATAVEAYSAAYNIRPLDPGVLDKRSDAHLARGDTAAAITDLTVAAVMGEAVPARFRRLATLFELQAVQSLQVGDLDGGVAAYNSAVSWAAQIPENCARTGCADRKRLETAHAKTVLARGEASLEFGLAMAAAQDFETFLFYNPDSRRVRLLSALAWETAGKADIAARQYRAVLDRWPDDEEAAAGIDRLAKGEEQLARLVQIELKRLGCDPGPIDGKWGGKSRTALENLARHGGVDPGDGMPDRRLLDRLVSYDSKICPQKTESELSGENAALGIDGGEDCFIFNDRLFCE
jgi:tetratricopeptide (TPR) repeat protein